MQDTWRPRNLNAYGLGHDTRILRSDFTWQPAGTLAVGDEVIAFEEQIMRGHRRQMRVTTVTSVSTALQPSYRLGFTDGRQVVVAEEHSLRRSEAVNDLRFFVGDVRQSGIGARLIVVF